MNSSLRSSLAAVTTVVLLASPLARADKPVRPGQFHLQEATIEQVQQAILAKQITTVQLVELYLARIKAYDGTCVSQPDGILGRIETVPNAGQINSLSTLNLRPATRAAHGFDARKARSLTDAADANPAMPDALETAAQLDRRFASTGKLAGPLHGVVFSIKDQYDTFDMRTTSGGDAPYANDRPPQDATFVQRLRAAGAIILAKANMGEYAAGARSAFGGTFCNPYDTERSPGGSSGGSGSSVAANLVMCSIGEESGPSIRSPAKNNNIVGVSPTQELVSRAGMIPASFMHDRVGPMCRTVADAARVLDIIAGYDPKDELTAFSIGRMPSQPYASFTRPQPLTGVRIGVVREYMNKKLFTAADAESIDIVDQAIGELRRLGATVVDPGAGGALFQSCLGKYVPHVYNSMFVRQYPQLFAVDAAGKPATDHVPLLLELFFDGQRYPADGPTIRGLATVTTSGERKYMMDKYLRARGDANIHSIDDLIAKSKFYTDVREKGGFADKKAALTTANNELTLDLTDRLQTRFAVQQIGLQCMAQIGVDVLTYPTSNIPAPKLGAPTEPTVNGRSWNAWTLLGQNGFPAITVPAGFTSQVYDRVLDPQAPDGSRLTDPVATRVPVGIDFLARPFDEPTMLRVAAAYEAASRHRQPPPGFAPLADEP